MEFFLELRQHYSKFIMLMGDREESKFNMKASDVNAYISVFYHISIHHTATYLFAIDLGNRTPFLYGIDET